MNYDFEGLFIEACDCFELCPCWVDDQPDEGHCTGLVAWDLTRGEIDGVGVAGTRVVAVTSHGSGRRDRGATTVLHVDADEAAQQRVLEAAFAPDEEGLAAREDPLAALSTVNGIVLETIFDQPITIEQKNGSWTVRVGNDECATVHAEGTPITFEEESHPLTLNHSALHHELQIKNESVAQRSESISLAVPALRGGGYIEARARSGMCGEFHYRHPRNSASG
ncbi:DUF1326 domain-containing protein [Actinomycetospora cinnamomea]|uniref:DUF1326 domain-containing protein n=1 Tax=Actinomycetospora cinnamomea TaxID=663609 RepID=A0A2U1FD98_9PSEU|nr:DUF1326 domain-containing protein [Actinomycetospora cinnamomea]PVZ10181.1 hypothetical protein C8D89_105258 [Actinomycetospora cinnamomea]